MLQQMKTRALQQKTQLEPLSEAQLATEAISGPSWPRLNIMPIEIAMPDLISHTVSHTRTQLRAPTIVGVFRDINRHEEATNRSSSIKELTTSPVHKGK